MVRRPSTSMHLKTPILSIEGSKKPRIYLHYYNHQKLSCVIFDKKPSPMLLTSLLASLATLKNTSPNTLTTSSFYRHLHKGSTSFTLAGSFCTLSFDNFLATSLKEDALFSLARRPPFPTFTNQNAKEPPPLVSIFVLVGIVVAGAALGHWMVRKFVISDDGSVDVGVAQFVKWAMRIIAATFIFQVAIVFITLDTPLAIGALASCLSICFLVISFKWNGPDSTITFGNSIYSANGNPWRSRGRANVRHNRAEFLSRSGMVASRGTLWNSPRRSSGWSDSPVKDLLVIIFGVPYRRKMYSSELYRDHKSSYDLLFILHVLVLTMILYDISDQWEGDKKSTGLLFNIP
ncbi:hypothetical protein TEA_017456 [Camellia sinensis var. sinensis]|uniref:Uncharacterized protein n=1 Tax=Camellia sinensis var. sinensis TaxID=542762 RepID=A0A4S4DD26_CAMSN|nr:hypothetical protein TEA_017456 [Camellia sinensis var. sinensis]